MAKVDFLICGRRGFDVLQQHVQTFGSNTVNCVASYADKKVKNDPFEELVQYCSENNILLTSRESYQPSESNFRFVIGWQWLFPGGNTTIVFHDSLLPVYRGFAPLVNSLIKGEEQTGVTAFFANDYYDEGEVIAQEAIQLQYPVTILEAMEQITPLYSRLSGDIFQKISKGERIISFAQDDSKATYSLWRDEDDYAVNWEQPAEDILRFINAVGFPYNGATSMLNGKKIIIHRAEVYPDVVIENRAPGKVIFIKDQKPVVVCSEGLLLVIDAVYTDSGEPIFPFIRLRSRFV